MGNFLKADQFFLLNQLQEDDVDDVDEPTMIVRRDERNMPPKQVRLQKFLYLLWRDKIIQPCPKRF